MENPKTKKTLKIGELAKAAGITVDTLRHYETENLLIPISRTEAGYRLYGKDAVDQLHFIRASKVVGFTLKEIRGLIALKYSQHSPCHEIHDLTTRRLVKINEDIEILKKMKSELETLIELCPQESDNPGGCKMLEGLDRQISI